MIAITLTHFCCGLSSTLTMSSLLEGIPFKTSAFRRRSMWGPRISWSFLIWSSLATSSNSVRKLFWFLKIIQSKQLKYPVWVDQCRECLCTSAFLWWFEGKTMLLFVVFGNLGQHSLSAHSSIHVYRKSLVKIWNLCISL